MTNKLIKVIEPCGPPVAELLDRHLSMLRKAELDVSYESLGLSTLSRLEEAGVLARSAQISDALHSDEVGIILSARGGYGASDLLGRIDWERLAGLERKCLIGFSDVTALQSALFTILGWSSLHASMPGSPLWQNGATVTNLITLLRAGRRDSWSGDIKLSPVAGSRPMTGPIEGQLFGGCLSVLSNLIGTRYLPQRFSRHILFFEDTGETAPRILRDWRQWLDAGLLTGVRAVVFGQFTECFSDLAEARWLLAELAERTPCPVFSSTDFGHIENNAPLGIGAEATIGENVLKWHFQTDTS